MNIVINRHDLCMAFIRTMYTNPSIIKIVDDDDLIVPMDKYDDLCHDIGVLLGRALRSVSGPQTDSK
jgi:hypothetical protein